MVFHVFNGRKDHLSPGISLGYINGFSSVSKPYIVIFCDKRTNRDKYIKLYNQLSFKDYCFIDSLFDFGKFVIKNANKPILIHGGEYQWYAIAVLLRAKNLNWVCWGAGSSIGKSMLSKSLTPIKRFLYNRFKSIVTLMDDDKESIANDFHVKKDIISVIPYTSTNKITKYDELVLELLETAHHDNRKPLVLLGNSPHNIPYYLEILPRLKHYKGKISVHCMNNYSLKKDSEYMQLISLGKGLFGEDFHSDEEFYDYEDYIRYMNNCDVYVCSRESQTGLGAIYMCLSLGKKVYIHGKNLNWLRNHFHATVFDTDDINCNSSFSDFSKPLTVEEKMQNNKTLIDNRMISYDKWVNYLRGLNQTM